MAIAGKIIGFIPTKNAERARSFYQDMLGLRFLSDDSFAIAMDSNGIMVRLVRMEQFTPAPYTILGWQVEDLGSTVKALAADGLVFQRYSFLKQDEDGIWTAPEGARVAWFQDPDGNLLSFSQH